MTVLFVILVAMFCNLFMAKMAWTVLLWNRKYI